MQNLPIQFTQTPPAKSGAVDAVSKIDPATPAPNDSFQNMLTRQVQIKQAGSKQPQSQPQNGQPQNAQAKSAQAAADVAQKNKTDGTATQAQKVASMDKVAADSVDIKTKVAVDADALAAKGLDKDKDGDNVESAATAAVDPALAGQLLAPVIPVVNGAVTADAQPADTAGQKSFSTLDTALNNALVQNKNAAGDGAGKLENEGVQDMKNGKDNAKVGADNTRWLDSVLPNAKLAVSESLDTTKLAGSLTKDLAVKDVAPVATYQPATLATNLQAAQQIGSANVINATPGKTGWDEAISQKVVWMVGSGEQSASLTLNPPDMGPLQVVIHVHNDQADTTFISDNPEVRQALENGLSSLRDKMGEAGIQLGQANVNSGGQAQQEFQRANQSDTGQSGTSGNDNVAQPERIVSSNTTVRVANGLVDTFA